VSCLLGRSIPLQAATFYWDADGDASSALGGSGPWDTTTALWRSGSTTGPLSLWPNSNPNSDTAVLSGTTGTLTIASGTTIYVNEINLNLGNRFILQAGDNDSLLVFSGTNPRVTKGPNNTAVTFRNRVDVGSGIYLEQDGTGSGAHVFEGTNQITGTGPIELRMGSSQYGMQVDITAPQESFGGGFRLENGRRRNVTLRAMATHSLGTGPVRATGFGTVQMTVWGAQMPVGDVPAGITAVSNATIRLPSSAASGTKDRLIVGRDAALAGVSEALSSVTRVDEFSASPTGPEVILSPGALVLHLTAASTTTVANLGTAADLLFGLDVNFASTSFSLTIGKGTPWRGFSNTTINDSGTGGRELRLQLGTVSIAPDTDSITLQGFGVDYSYNLMALILGNGTATPRFLAVSDPCPARIVRHVKIDTSTPDFPGLSGFLLTPGAQLSLLRAGASGAKAVEMENGSLLAFVPATAGSSETVGHVTVRGQATVRVTRKTAGTPDTLTLSSVIRTNQGVLRIVSATAGQLGSDERIKITDTNELIRGNIVDPWVQGAGEFLTYGANGFAVYPSYVTSLSSLGDGVVFKGSGTLTANATLDSMIMTGSISGPNTLTAGVLPDSSRAARVGLMGTADNISMAPAFDAGSAELLVHYPQGSTRVLSLNGVVTANGLVKTGSGIVSLRGKPNNISGAVRIWEGTLRIDNTSDGLNPEAWVTVASGATYDIVSPANNVETNAVVRGEGTINLASGKTLAITSAVEVADTESSLSVTGSGTLRFVEGSVLAVALDVANDSRTVPRLSMPSATLDLTVAPVLRITSVANRPTGDFEQTFPIVQYGSRSGTFASTVECPQGVKGTLSYDDATRVVSVTLTPSRAAGTVIVIR